MSRGYIGYARLFEDSDTYLLYEYSGENWNLSYEDGDALLFDGLIYIDKKALTSCEISNNIMQNNIKIIKPCKNAFNIFTDIEFDYIAIKLIKHILKDFKLKGDIPLNVSFIQ